MHFDEYILQREKKNRPRSVQDKLRVVTFLTFSWNAEEKRSKKKCLQTENIE